MRIDKFLKVSRIIKRRTLAKEVCDSGRVSVNGKIVKAGYEVHVGDQVEIQLPSGTRRVVIEKIVENVPANRASELFHEV
ncbi:MAG: RNA-binding S4 domain-containing protein [Sulfobacillus thermosulfidooxidans]|uniref:RQC P-site tRNA stabilizing factor n=1 Tax=Sulfobacillus thermosulfidooxidans TaxID=28034 RepID=A0A2T2X2Y5_SULTH|nr:MAG: RNA-binding S4 domain-containing protein [Sulfobacillus thermosulfidooxidans]